jgi:hypothetical protein
MFQRAWRVSQSILKQYNFFDPEKKLLTCACLALEICVPCDSLGYPRALQGIPGHKEIFLMSMVSLQEYVVIGEVKTRMFLF